MDIGLNFLQKGRIFRGVHKIDALISGPRIADKNFTDPRIFLILGFPMLFLKKKKLGVQSWSPFVARKSGHIWRIWAEVTQTLMSKSTKVAQIHLPECNFAKIRQISAKISQVSAKIRQISQISFHKRALTLNTPPKKRTQAKPRKSKGFCLCGTPKILGKGRKTHTKSKENRKRKKTRKSKKSKDWRVRAGKIAPKIGPL